MTTFSVLVIALAGVTFLAILVLYLQARLENRRLHLDRVKARCKHNTVKTLKCDACTKEAQEFFDEDSECESDYSQCPCGEYIDYTPEPETPEQLAARQKLQAEQDEAAKILNATNERIKSGMLSKTCVTCNTVTYGIGARCRCFPFGS